MITPSLTVLHVDSAREYRGGQNQARLLMAGLEGRSDVRQALLAGAGSRLARMAADMGVTVFEVPWVAATDAHALRALRAHLSDDWDVVHAHDGHAVQAVLLSRAISGGRTRIVASRRVDFPPRTPSMWRRADLIIAVSHAIKAALLARGIDRRRIAVVHSGIDPVELEPVADGPTAGDLRAAARAGPEHLLVAAVGALVPHKDHRTLVRAAAQLRERWPSTRFAVFGEGPERAALQHQVDEAGLTDRFVLPGQVDGLARVLSDIDVFAMPSRKEGLGTACIEAMMSGRPIVATSAGGLAELAAAGAFRPLPAEDPDALAGEIERLLGSVDARAEAEDAARRSAAQFTAEAMVRGTLRCYRVVTRQPA